MLQWVNPLTGRVSSGYRTKARPGHLGGDVVPDPGILFIGAAAAGRVVGTRTNSYPGDRRTGLLPGHTGNAVLIEHAPNLRTYYGHPERVLVEVGDVVTAGENIAVPGNTGNSTGRHLHYGVLLDGILVDPFAWQREHGAPLGSGRAALPPTSATPPQVFPPAPVQSARTLRLGSSGPRVGELQRALNGWKTDLPRLVPDNRFGTKTQRRVREWQERNHGGVYPAWAAVDGIAGPLTLDPLGVR